jgi:hypothetical protein
VTDLSLLFGAFFRLYRTCSRCGFPYRDEDLVPAKGFNRWLCRWHRTYGL